MRISTRPRKCGATRWSPSAPPEDKAYDVAKAAAEAAYAFEFGPILFKPKLAADQPFRPDLAGTLSYFVTGNDNYAEDKGFALKP